MKNALFITCCLSLSTAAFAQHTAKTTHAATWEPIKESDITWKKRTLTDIDIKGSDNTLFKSTNDNARTSLISTLINGVMSNQFKAYSGADDHFTTALSKEAFSILISPSFDPARVTGFRTKSDYLILKDKTSVVRIVGLAPLTPTKDPSTGTTTEQPMFWVYYPDATKFLSQSPVSASNDQTWYDVLEAGQFRGRIIQAGESDVKK